MKIVKRAVLKDSSGTLVIIAQETEDLWQAYNLINVDDRVSASTVRRLNQVSTTGSSTSTRVRVTLTIKAERIDFDSTSDILHVSGPVAAENKHVRMGAYHTLDIPLNLKFSITKDEWDSVSIGRLEDLANPENSSDLAAVIMQEGLCHVCLVSRSLTILKCKIEVSIPKKRRGGQSQHDKTLHRFYTSCMDAIIRHIDFNVVKCVLIASPGFVKDSFWEFMKVEAARREGDYSTILQHKGHFVLTKASSPYLGALKEILADPSITGKLQGARVADDVSLMQRFMRTIGDDPDRAVYGEKEVLYASNHAAIEHLLIVDTLFRSPDVVQRKKWVDLVETTKENQGAVAIMSSQHATGEQLTQVTGVAAILRFPLPGIDELSDSDEDSDDSD
eukprot:TRINITY_DN17584_c0_g1_i1.p1 TRINITY_DN17584_c0_g1~~TRINITY_DN17584_c0_g1_i1.p1  ORF type:complete len:390 (-),score=42.90 TRINITY_DN17584_c0_g1_i1:47-1216(-)